jgi:hypothetical protein
VYQVSIYRSRTRRQPVSAHSLSHIRVSRTQGSGDIFLITICMIQYFFGLCCYLLAEFLRRNITADRNKRRLLCFDDHILYYSFAKDDSRRTLARTCWCALAIADSPSDRNTIRDRRRRISTSTVSAARPPFTSAPPQPIKKLSVPLSRFNYYLLSPHPSTRGLHHYIIRENSPNTEGCTITSLPQIYSVTW